MKFYLSRYFSENTRLISGKCWKCYEEMEDVKLVSVNSMFLLSIGEDISSYFEYLPRKNKKSNQEVGPVFTGGIKTILLEDFEKFFEFCIKNQILQSNHNILKLESKTPKREDKLSVSSKYFSKKLERTTPYQLVVFAKKKNNCLKDPNSMKYNWMAPKSPHNLIEESLFQNPWQLLVATIFLNKTKCMAARPNLLYFLKEFPSPKDVLNRKPESFRIFFHNLGLDQVRSEQLWKMTYDFLCSDWKDANELYGIGKYGQDAFQMFCLGNFEVDPTDRFLKIYKAWYKKFQSSITYKGISSQDSSSSTPV